MKTLSIALAASLLFALPLYADNAKQSHEDYVIMKVGGDDVKKSEVETVLKSVIPGGNPPDFDTLDEKLKDNILRDVASEHVIEKQAEKSGIENSQEVKDRIEAAKNQILIQEFLRKKAKELVTDDKLRAAYAESIKKPEEEEIHAYHILVKTKEEADKIEKQLKNGADFEKLAKEKSEDKSSGASGGDLGWFTADKMVPEFSKAAFALKKGEISAPVKSDFGWHIIKVEGRRKVTPPTFEQEKEQLSQQLGNKAIGDYINNIMKNEKIVVYDANGKSRDLPPPPASGGKKSDE